MPVLTLVKQALSMGQPEHSRTLPPEPRKTLVYIVDDEVVLADLARASLEPGPYVIQQFQDPELALRSFLRAKRKPDLLLSDYAMGKMSGLELIQHCKEAHPDLKTILISGTAGADILQSASVKIDQFLGKPYEPAVLRELVEAVMAG